MKWLCNKSVGNEGEEQPKERVCVECSAECAKRRRRTRRGRQRERETVAGVEEECNMVDEGDDGCVVLDGFVSFQMIR